MNLYLIAVAIGLALAGIWIGWLLGVRAYLRVSKSTPGAVLSLFQVVAVLALMLVAYRVSERCFQSFGINGPDAPALMLRFRRIWILVWGAGMAASIQLFLDIRRMSMPGGPTVRKPSPSPRDRRRRR